MSECHFSWQAQHLVMSECHFSWQAQYLVMSECHFSWQAQYSVKFEKIAGARNVVIFNTKCVSEARKVTSANGRVRDDEFMLGSCSDHVRIMVESAAHWNWRFNRSRRISLRFWSALLRGRRSIW